MYDAAGRRFMAVDPAKDGDNWYVYCKDNPILFIDVFGYWAYGDSKYSFEVQLQLLALAKAYLKNSKFDFIKKTIADKENMIRKTATLKDVPFKISQRLDNRISINGGMTESELDKELNLFRVKFTGGGIEFDNYQLHIGLSNENLVNINGNDGKSYKGGNQAWLTTNFQKNTGCGSISVINVMFYYYNKLICNNTSKIITQDEFVNKYLEYYGAVPTKKSSLIVTPEQYARDAKEIIAKETGINFTETIKRAYDMPDSKTALGIIAGALMDDNPVALQNLLNDSGSVYTWHFVTITALDISVFDVENSKLTCSSWGRLDPRVNYTISDAWRPGASIVYLSQDGGWKV